jgi:hypothetical protein
VKTEWTRSRSFLTSSLACSTCQAKQTAPAVRLDHPPRILLLCSSLPERSFSRFMTEEATGNLDYFSPDGDLSLDRIAELRTLCL